MDSRQFIIGASNWFGNTRMDYNGLCDMTPEELLKVYFAFTKCEYDFTPDDWAWWQVQAAVQGAVPQWNNDEEPLYNEETRAALIQRLPHLEASKSEWAREIFLFLEEKSK